MPPAGTMLVHPIVEPLREVEIYSFIWLGHVARAPY